jgi:hypothetical protein
MASQISKYLRICSRKFCEYGIWFPSVFSGVTFQINLKRSLRLILAKRLFFGFCRFLSPQTVKNTCTKTANSEKRLHVIVEPENKRLTGPD